MAIGSISNFTGAALDQQLFAVDARSAQSTLLNGNLFGTLGGAQQAAMDAILGGIGGFSFSNPSDFTFPTLDFSAPAGLSFPGLGSVAFQAPQAASFAQGALQSLGSLSGGWAGMLGGSTGMMPFAGGCH